MYSFTHKSCICQIPPMGVGLGVRSEVSKLPFYLELHEMSRFDSKDVFSSLATPLEWRLISKKYSFARNVQIFTEKPFLSGLIPMGWAEVNFYKTFFIGIE